MASDIKKMLDKLRKQLPNYYVNDLLKIINEDPSKPESFSFNKSKVKNVFSGQVQDLESVATVLEASKVLIKRRESLIKKGLSIKKAKKVA